MMERWAKYKNQFINMAAVPYVEYRHVDKDFITYSSVEAKKGSKSWVVFAGHQPVASCGKKTEAEKIAEDLVKGVYDVK